MVIIMGIGVKMEYIMGVIILMLEFGVGSDNWSMIMDILVFWILVFMVIVRIFCLLCFVMKVIRVLKVNL